MDKKTKPSIGAHLDKLLGILEKNRTNLITATLLVLVYILLRMFFEGTLFHSDESGVVRLSLYNAFHQITGLFTAFLGGALIMTYLSKENVRKVVNAMLWGFWLVALGPIFDFYVFQREEGYQYINLNEALTQGIGVGLIIILSSILILGSAYVLLKSKSVVRAFLSAIFLFALIAASFLPLMLSPIYAHLPVEAEHMVITLLFFLISTIFVLSILDLSNKKFLPTLLKKMKVHWMLYFLAVSLAGIALSGRFVLWEYDGLAYNMPYVIVVILAILLAGQSLLMMDDIYKVMKKKRKKIYRTFTKSQYFQSAILLALFACAFCLQLSVYSMLSCLGFILIGWAYYSSPFRLSDTRFGAMFFGVLSILAFSMGLFATKDISELSIANWVIVAPSIELNALPQTMIFVMVLIFFTGFIVHLLLGRGKTLTTKKSGRSKVT
jgi:hypothetical protein